MLFESVSKSCKNVESLEICNIYDAKSYESVLKSIGQLACFKKLELKNIRGNQCTAESFKLLSICLKNVKDVSLFLEDDCIQDSWAPYLALFKEMRKLTLRSYRDSHDMLRKTFSKPEESFHKPLTFSITKLSTENLYCLRELYFEGVNCNEFSTSFFTNLKEKMPNLEIFNIDRGYGSFQKKKKIDKVFEKFSIDQKHSTY